MNRVTENKHNRKTVQLLWVDRLDVRFGTTLSLVKELCLHNTAQTKNHFLFPNHGVIE